ncbi:MAG: hypothetical protein HQ577_06575 [Dehalococcoidia bacterium]|nr:hypothetical protein [Dehalococcoidia bacterium]
MAKPDVLKPGYFVAVSLIPETAPECCYIGLVQVLDEYGVRMTQVEWDDQLDGVKQFSEDIFVPWVNVNSMLVCTQQEPTRRFVRDRAPAWKAQVEAMYKRSQEK